MEKTKEKENQEIQKDIKELTEKMTEVQKEIQLIKNLLNLCQCGNARLHTILWTDQTGKSNNSWENILS